MRFTIRHATRYDYDTAGSLAVQRLRMTPADNPAQRIRNWRIEAPGIEVAPSYLDGFGNRVHLIAHNEIYESLTIVAGGEAETSDTGGVLGELPETCNPALFMRRTSHTDSSPEIDTMAERLASGATVARLHHLMEAIASRVEYIADTTDTGTTAAQAFAAGAGVCQDHAHIFIAGARCLGIPARYVTGYLHLEGDVPSAAHHAWAEAYVRGLGWVGFDPANRICPTERYIRLACGFDAAGAAPIAGTRRGGGAEVLTVDVVVQQQEQQQQ